MVRISFFLFFSILFHLVSQENQQIQNQQQENQQIQNQQQENLLQGFGEVAWETPYQEVLDRFSKLIQAGEQEEKIEIIQEIEEKLLVIKRNDVLYTYRFYQQPQVLANLDPENATAEINTETKEVTYKAIGFLYSVSSIFSYLPKQELQEILEGKYGNPQKTIFDKKNQSNGAVLWDLSSIQEEPQGGIIMLWFENYQNSNFSRKIDYVSTKLKQEIENDYNKYYKVKETKLLKEFVP